MSDGKKESSAERMVRWLEAGSDAQTCEERDAALAADSALHAEFEALQALDADLLGLAGMESTPDPDLMADVLAGVQALAAGTKELRPLTPPGEADIMAWIEGGLEPETAAHMTYLFSADSGMQEEAEALRALHQDLELIGGIVNAGMPEVRLVDSVMGIVRGASQVTPQPVTPFRTRPKPAAAPVKRGEVIPMQARFWQAAALAMAACLLIALGFLLHPMLTSLNTPRDTRMAEGSKEKAVENSTGQNGSSQETHPDESPFKALEPIINPLLLADAEPGSTSKDTASVTDLQSVLNDRRAALTGDNSALHRLNQLASLSGEKATELLRKSGLSESALLGLARYLDKKTAVRVIEQVAADNPNDTAVRYALAMESEGTDAYGENLNAWAGQDQGNALPLYYEARQLLVEKDTGNALSTIASAAERESARAYGLSSAQNQRDALIAGGLDPEVAQLLAATAAGSQEYGSITSLGLELIQFGKYYEEQGDFDSAEQIYQSVLQMGMQVQYGAELSNEALAGIDTQINALNAIQQMYESLNATEEITPEITSVYSTLMESLSHFSEFLTQVNNLFNSDDPAAINGVTAGILENGDLALVEKN